MIKADEAREIVREVKAKEEQARKEKILEFCAHEVSEKIKQAANKGETRTVITCPEDIKIGVIQALRVKGNFAVVDNTDNTISICW